METVIHVVLPEKDFFVDLMYDDDQRLQSIVNLVAKRLEIVKAELKLYDQRNPVAGRRRVYSQLTELHEEGGDLLRAFYAIRTEIVQRGVGEGRKMMAMAVKFFQAAQDRLPPEVFIPLLEEAQKQVLLVPASGLVFQSEMSNAESEREDEEVGSVSVSLSP